MLSFLVRKLSYGRRLRLAERILPEQPNDVRAEAGKQFRIRRQEWTKFAIWGSGAALGVLLATASWDGAAAQAAHALAISARGFVAALAFAMLAAALGVWEDVCKVRVVHKPDLPDEPAWDDQEATRRYYEQDWHEDNAPRTIPAAIRWYVADWGATLFLALSALAFVGAAADAALRIGDLPAKG